MLNWIVALILITIGTVSCQNECPNPPVQQNFDPSKYTGAWYEIQRFPLFNEQDLKCIKAEYTTIDAYSVKVNNSGLNVNTGNYDIQLGSAAIPNPSVPAKLLVTFEFGPIKVTSDYWVLETDYNYSLVYSCRITLGAKNEFAWILSRQRTLNQATVNTLVQKLQSYGADVSKFLVTDQSNCN